MMFTSSGTRQCAVTSMVHEANMQGALSVINNSSHGQSVRLIGVSSCRSALKMWCELREERERVSAHYQVRHWTAWRGRGGGGGGGVNVVAVIPLHSAGDTPLHSWWPKGKGQVAYEAAAWHSPTANCGHELAAVTC